MTRVYRETGPAKSGKTQRLVTRANVAVATGARATLHTTEHAPGYLRQKYLLDSEVKVVVHPFVHGIDPDEWLEVSDGKRVVGKLPDGA